ncbi:MAG: DUF3108 domain-containing protein [Candidatus Delongbacteria bacterium]|jgi:hypothetical protein|nr:DUF3108 domain-containing protein [Candidatus Delongbacteria bacterium]
MKKLLYIFLIIYFATSYSQENNDSLKVRTFPFQNGEYLHFEVSYGYILAGYATIETRENKHFKGKDCFIFKTTAKSRNAFNWVYKVRDWTKSYFDKDSIRSVRFEKHLREGSYNVDIEIDYDQDKHIAKYFRKKKGKKNKNKEIKIPPNVIDALSALFYVRMQDLKVGKEILIPATDNTKIYNIKVLVLKKETIKTEAGKFKCFVVEPIMADGGVFKKDGKVKVWITDDERKMPVKMETKLFFGSIVAELDWFTLK